MAWGVLVFVLPEVSYVVMVVALVTVLPYRELFFSPCATVRAVRSVAGLLGCDVVGLA